MEFNRLLEHWDRSIFLIPRTQGQFNTREAGLGLHRSFSFSASEG